MIVDFLEQKASKWAKALEKDAEFDQESLKLPFSQQKDRVSAPARSAKLFKHRGVQPPFLKLNGRKRRDEKHAAMSLDIVEGISR